MYIFIDTWIPLLQNLKHKQSHDMHLYIKHRDEICWTQESISVSCANLNYHLPDKENLNKNQVLSQCCFPGPVTWILGPNSSLQKLSLTDAMCCSWHAKIWQILTVRSQVKLCSEATLVEELLFWVVLWSRCLDEQQRKLLAYESKEKQQKKIHPPFVFCAHWSSANRKLQYTNLNLIHVHWVWCFLARSL